MDLYSLRSACRKHGSSPIVFADALPVGIEHSNENKLALRDQLTPTQLDEHLSALLQMPIIKRLAMIVCAGHREGTRGSSDAQDLFSRAFDTFNNYAKAHDLPIVETPAMLRYNSIEIRDRFTVSAAEHQHSVSEILTVFDEQAPD